MRLETCHIENFGKLSDVTIDFTPGCNVINRENGWGKSTLADFIRVMFYGFANERTRKSDYENERKRYTPWQGGTYGGQITFQTAGKRYVLTRTFGTREKDDTYELRNADTNMVCDDFSTEIGQELFHINRESFQKTVFISHNDCETVSTDDIHAKIGNLAEYTDDIKNYQQVVTKLTDTINGMSPRRKTGSLYKEKEKIQGLEAEIHQGQGIQDAIAEKEQLRDREKERQQELQGQIAALQQEQVRLGKLKDAKSMWEQYQTRKTDVSERQKQLENAASVFPEEIPVRNQLEENIRECSRLAQLENASSIYRFDPEKEELWQQLSETFSAQKEWAKPEEIRRQIADWNQCSREKEQVEQLRMRLEKLKREREVRQASARKQKNPALLVIGIMLVAVGIVLCVFLGVPGVILALAGVGFILAGVFLGRNKGKSVEEDAAEKEQTQLEQKLAGEEKLVAEKTAQLKSFCETYGITYDPYQILSRLMELEQQQKQYEELKKQSENYRVNVEKYQGLSQQLQDYIRRIGFEPEEDIAGQLRRVGQLLDAYENADREYEEAKKRLIQFEQSHDVSTLAQPEPEGADQSMEELAQKIGELSEQVDAVKGNITSYNGQIQADREEQEILFEKEEELKQRKIFYQEQKTRLDYLEKTRHYLEVAKESFTSRHMEPVMGAFRKYYRLLTGCSGDNFHIDANMNITVSELGMQREVEFFSAGYRDLIGLCLRMAFVHAMYQEEKPFILLDDPFVNLDGQKGAAGLDFVREIAAEYQVIYFTCRRERDVNFMVQTGEDCATL
ncbi:MAG: ATP-binding protein [Roseburia sp.]